MCISYDTQVAGEFLFLMQHLINFVTQINS